MCIFSLQYATDITKSSTIIEEGPRVSCRGIFLSTWHNSTFIKIYKYYESIVNLFICLQICPICSSIVRIFYINFFSKVFMCSNTECLYPFEENFTVYSSDDDGLYGGEQFTPVSHKRSTRSHRSAKSTRSTGQGSRRTSTLGTNSNLSGSEWAEMSQAYDSDDNVSTTSSKMFSRKFSQRQMEKRVKQKEDEQLIKQNVEKIKECNKVLFDANDELGTIWNEKWITNLSSMQSSSGMKLVKEHELKKLKKTQKNICHTDVKIDIESKKDAMSSIVIEIDNVALDGKRIKKT